MDNVINDPLLEELLRLADINPRLRQSLDLRDTPEESTQRMLNALAPGTILPVHRHNSTSETCILIKGKLKVIYYDNEGNETDFVELDPLKGVYGISIPAGQWHKAVALAPSVIIETKTGTYKPLEPSDILIPEV